MSNDNVIAFAKPPLVDALQQVLKEGAQQLLQQAIELEVLELLEMNRSLTTDDGKQAVVRNGYLPERAIQTGLGDIKVKVPKVRDRSGGGIKFNSKLVPPYLKKAKAIEELLPYLYLKGISTGDFSEALSSLLGVDATGLSASTISRLKKDWIEEYKQWQQRDLSRKRYVYVWADGVHTNVRQDDRLSLLVMIGSTEDGKKELLGLVDGFRESTDSWKEVIMNLQKQGLTEAPKLLIGDGAMGLWAAANELWPQTEHQRCWVHKTANVMNSLPKAMQPKVKEDLHNIWMADTRQAAYDAFDHCINKYQGKYPKAMSILAKNKAEMLAFYDFPSEHWLHIRTTNPIESVFATVRLRGKRTKNCGSRETTLSMTFKLIESAQNRWKRLRGYKLLAEVIRGVKFENGERINENVDQSRRIA